MVSTATDAIDGVSTSTAMKAPCRCRTTAAITLSGWQTVDGVVLADGDENLRVLVADQDDPAENGLYDAGSSAWQRCADFDGARDVRNGTLVTVTSGTVHADTEWRVVATDPVEPGTTEVTFESATFSSAASVSWTPAGTGAVQRTVQEKLRSLPVSFEDFGAVLDGTTDDTAAIQAALDSGRSIRHCDPNKTAKISSTLNWDDTSEGVSVDFGYLTLKPTSAVTKAIVINHASDVEDWEIKNLRIDMTNMTDASTRIGIEQQNAWGGRIQNIHYLNEGTNKRGYKAVAGAYTTVLENVMCRYIELAGTSLGDAVTTLTFLNCDVDSYVIDYAVSIDVIGGAVQGSLTKFAVSNARGIYVAGVDIEGTGTAFAYGADVTHFFSYGNQWSGFSGTYESGTTPPIGAWMDPYGSGVFRLNKPTVTVGGVLSVSVTQTGLFRNSIANSSAGTVTNQVDLRIGEGTSSNDVFIGLNYGGASNGYIDNRSATDSFLIKRAGTTIAELKAGLLDVTGVINASNKIFPGTDAAAKQSVCGLYAGNGAPNNANGSNGDFYLRGDGTKAGDTVIYHKEGGSWVALVTA